jgi:hypothetical protein
MPRTTDRPGRVWLTGALAGAAVGGLLAAFVVVSSPAQAVPQGVPVACDDNVTLRTDGITYDLQGTCGVVVVKASGTVVDVPSSRKLVVRGHDNAIDARPGDRLVVRGHDNRVAITSTRVLDAASPGSVVTVDGLVEEGRLAERGLTLRARQVTDLRVGGRGHDVTTRRGYDARVPGDRNAVRFRRLDTLGVSGDHNSVVVRRYATTVRDSGEGNTIRVNRRR